MGSFPWRPGVVGTHEQMNFQAFWKFEDLAELAAAPTANLPAYATQAPIYAAVPGVGLYRYDPDGAAAVDGYSIVQANGVGKWVQEIEHADLNYSIYPDIPECLPIVQVNPWFTSISAGATQSKTVTVPGARIGDMVLAVPPSGFQSQLRITSAEVTAKNTVTITLANNATPIGPVTQSLNFGSIGNNSEATLTVTVTGATTADAVHVTAPGNLNNGVWVRLAWVSATNTVSIRLRNTSGGSVDPPAGNYIVSVVPTAAVTPTAGLWRVLVLKPNTLPAITVPGLRLYLQLLGGEYASGAALEAELGISNMATEFSLMLASTRRRHALLDDAAAKAVIQASTTANAIMEFYEGAGY